jgi:hypothetical protein
MALLLTPRHFVTEMEENVKSIDNRVNDYIQDSSLSDSRHNFLNQIALLT